MRKESIPHQDDQEEHVRIKFYSSSEGYLLSPEGQRLQQGKIMSRTILQHEKRAVEDSFQEGFSDALPQSVQGYLDEASEYLGLPSDAHFWERRVNSEVDKAVDGPYQHGEVPLTISIQLSSEVAASVRKVLKE